MRDVKDIRYREGNEGIPWGNMRIEILKDDEKRGIKRGEEWEAEPFILAPIEKVVLMKRVSDGYIPPGRILLRRQSGWYRKLRSGSIMKSVKVEGKLLKG